MEVLINKRGESIFFSYKYQHDINRMVGSGHAEWRKVQMKH